MKEKLRRVIEWVQQAGSSLHNMHLHGHQVFSSPSVLLLSLNSLNFLGITVICSIVERA